MWVPTYQLVQPKDANFLHLEPISNTKGQHLDDQVLYDNTCSANTSVTSYPLHTIWIYLQSACNIHAAPVNGNTYPQQVWHASFESL